MPRLAGRVNLPLAAILIAAAALRLAAVTRPGYSPDEELTYFAVEGVRAGGLPLLPSGVVYDRGLPYTYAAWLASLIPAPPLAAYRTISALFGVWTAFLVFVAGRRLGAPHAALAAATLATIDPTLIALSQWGRFYTMFLACYLAGLLAALDGFPDTRRVWRFAATVAVARLLHELGASLALVPLFLMVLRPAGSPAAARAGRALGAALIALLLVQAALFGLRALGGSESAAAVGAYLRLQITDALMPPVTPALAPWRPIALAIGAVAMGAVAAALRRYLGAAAVLLACGAALAYAGLIGAILLLAACWTIVKPGERARIAVSALAFAAASTAFWSAQTSVQTGTPFTPALLWSTLVTGLSYPTDALRYFGEANPVLFALLAIVVGALALEPRAGGDEGVRALALTMMTSLAALGGVRFGFDARYFALFTLMALLLATRLATRDAGPRARLAIAAAALLVAMGQYRVVWAADPTRGGFEAIREAWVPVTMHDPSWSTLARILGPDDRAICNDELACRYILGRSDAWLAIETFDREHFAMRTGRGLRGLYGGSEVIATEEQLERAIRAPAGGAVWLLLVNSGKFEYARYERLALDLVARGAAERAGGVAGAWLLVRIVPRPV